MYAILQKNHFLGITKNADASRFFSNGAEKNDIAAFEEEKKKSKVRSRSGTLSRNVGKNILVLTNVLFGVLWGHFYPEAMLVGPSKTLN